MILAVERLGTVLHVAVEEGERVKKGQLLAQLDDRAAKSGGQQQRVAIARALAMSPPLVL